MKKLFALASVTALAGVVFASAAVGCSSSQPGSGSTDDGGDGGGGKDAGKDVNNRETGDDTGEGGTDCPAAYPGDPPWKSPAQVQTVCDQSDIDFIKAEAQKQGETFQQLETALKARKAACATCVFTKEADAAWGPIVYVGTQGGAFFNYGSCFARAPGGSEDCGKAVESFELCADAVCDKDACGSDNAVQACVKQVAADKNSCGKFNFTAACPSFTALNNYCRTGLDVIAIMCGPGPLDGGG
jgi:hypothetical protein